MNSHITQLFFNIDFSPPKQAHVSFPLRLKNIPNLGTIERFEMSFQHQQPAFQPPGQFKPVGQFGQAPTFKPPETFNPVGNMNTIQTSQQCML
jgi:hypothetical protein